MSVSHRVQVSAVSAGVSGAQAWVPLDIYQNPFLVSWFVQVTGPMGASYTVEGTQNNVLAEASVARAQAFAHPDASGAVASQHGVFDAPIRAIRLWTTPVASGANQLVFTVTQGV